MKQVMISPMIMIVIQIAFNVIPVIGDIVLGEDMLLWRSLLERWR